MFLNLSSHGNVRLVLFMQVKCIAFWPWKPFLKRGQFCTGVYDCSSRLVVAYTRLDTGPTTNMSQCSKDFFLKLNILPSVECGGCDGMHVCSISRVPSAEHLVSLTQQRASERCHQEKRKTINGEDILFAMSTLGFDNYVEPLKLYLQKYREVSLSISVFFFVFWSSSSLEVTSFFV